MLQESDTNEFENLIRDHHNTHASLMNLKPSDPIEEISALVNHLASLIVNTGCKVAPIEGQQVDLFELRRTLKWYSSLIKKLQKEGRSLYFIHHGGRINAGRTSTLIKTYFHLVHKLLIASEGFGSMLVSFEHGLREEI